MINNKHELCSNEQPVKKLLLFFSSGDCKILYFSLFLAGKYNWKSIRQRKICVLRLCLIEAAYLKLNLCCSMLLGFCPKFTFFFQLLNAVCYLVHSQLTECSRDFEQASSMKYVYFNHIINMRLSYQVQQTKLQNMVRIWGYVFQYFIVSKSYCFNLLSSACRVFAESGAFKLYSKEHRLKFIN